jgi:Family of unknown function (DUF6025)
VTVTALLESLRLPADGADVESLAARRHGLAWRHLGRSSLPMAALPRVLHAAPGCPPRTGHLADWQDIWHGCSGVLDYNTVISKMLGIGYPLLYDFIQTETAALDQGDTLYLPGSLLCGGIREVLELEHWRRGRFTRCDRSGPLFMPYVQARTGDRRLPLAELHRERARAALPPDVLDFHAALWSRQRRLLAEILITLVDRAPDDHALGQLFDRVACLDGRVMRSPAHRDGDRFRAGDASYDSAEALVAASLLPLAAAARSGGLAEVMAELPASVPLASVDAVALSYALLGAHRPGRQPAGNGEPDLHLQWGALAMAGCPPGSRGYFARHAGQVRWMYDAAVHGLAWVSPVVFVIAPAAPYFLWLPDTDEEDLQSLGVLLRRVRAQCPPGDDLLAAAAPRVRRLVSEWRAERVLSPGLRRRLRWRDRVAPGPAPLPPATLAAPPGFGDLTVSQACLVVSALIAAVADAPLARAGKEAQ